MGLLDTSVEEPHSKRLFYAVFSVALILLTAFGIWFFFLRYLTEKRIVTSFMDAVVAGNDQLAYQIWKPHGTYSYADFMSDWGTKGYYGPVGSYRIEAVSPPRNVGNGEVTGVIAVVELSPYQPFPSDQDPKSGRNREVSIWIERSDGSLSFPP